MNKAGGPQSVTKTTKKHTIEVGDFDTGTGVRVHIDGTDVTDALIDLFPPMYDNRDMRVPYGKNYIADVVKMKIQNGDIVVNKHG